MSQDRPDLADLLATVQEFLDRVGPKLVGEDRYHAQVASYILAIAGREIRQPARVAAEERWRLAAFLGRDGDLAELMPELGARIRDGSCDARWDETMAVVLRQVVDKVRVVRPDHLAIEHGAGHGQD